MARMPYLHDVGLNARVLLFAAAIAASAAAVFALTPVAHLSSSKVRSSLGEGSRGSAGLGWRRLGSRLVVVELATAMVLLVGAGLLGKSLHGLLQVNLGLEPEYFPGIDPIGQRLVWTVGDPPPLEIVGVVDDIKENALVVPTPPALYVSFDQDPTSAFVLFARTASDEEALLPSMAAAIHKIDPGISTAFPRSMSEILNRSPAAYLRRASASLMTGFAAAAWLLGVIGLYGVVAYSVSQRTREVGVRVALGAAPRSVFRLIMTEAGALIALGVVLGAIGSLAPTSVMRGLLFGVPGGRADAPRRRRRARRIDARRELHSGKAGGVGQSHRCAAR